MSRESWSVESNIFPSIWPISEIFSMLQGGGGAWLVEKFSHISPPCSNGQEMGPHTFIIIILIQVSFM